MSDVIDALIERINRYEAPSMTDLVRQLAMFRAEELCLRYNLGRIVHLCRYNPSPEQGPRAIARLALVSGMAPSTLRRYARVSEVIRPIEFGDILRLRGPSGLPLSWSHIEELAECRNHLFRLLCAKEAVASALSVRELRCRVRVAGA